MKWWKYLNKKQIQEMKIYWQQENGTMLRGIETLDSQLSSSSLSNNGEINSQKI